MTSCLTHLEVLSNEPSEIDNRVLRQFPGFEDFHKGGDQSPVSKSAKSLPPTLPAPVPVELSPSEQLEMSYKQLRSALAQELLDRIKSASPVFFELLVVDLLVAMGYGGSRADAGQAVGGSGDGGIDGIIKEDRLGLDFVYLQAKRWEGVVGRPIVQGFAGSLEGARARKGVMITTSSFSKEALDYVRRIEKRIVLIDGEHLAQYMLDFGIGVSEVTHYRVQRVDLDYFGEE